ncbi:MAG: CPBP family glutamic-type intramembrane protease [Cyanobacteria bacterium P01_C01_bin.89]
MGFLSQIQEKVTSAMLTVPTTKDWIVAAVLLLIVAATCLPLGLWCKFLDVRTPKLSAIKTIRILVDRLLFPCFAEELIFRVLLLPVKNNLISIKVKLLLGAVSLTAYVASHPINATLFYKQASETFINPFFLFSTTVLGIACTFAYTISGSIWTPIAIHWITVIGWLLALGGYSKLGFTEK